MLMMLGEKDNITPAKICIDYSERIKQAGLPIETIIYPGAAHGFTDAKLSGKTVRHKVLADYSKCIDRSVQMNFDCTWFYPFKNQIFEDYVDWNDLTSDCRKNGQGEIGDPSKVRKQFYQDLKTFISTLFL